MGLHKQYTGVTEMAREWGYNEARIRYFWRGYLLGIATGLGIACLVCLWSCTPSGTQPPRRADLYPNRDTSITCTLPDDTSIDTPIIDTFDGPGVQPPRLPWLSPTPTIVMLFRMRDHAFDYGARDGIFHGRVVGETDPFLFGFVDRMSHVLVMQQMNGADVPLLPCTIEIYKSRGKP